MNTFGWLGSGGLVGSGFLRRTPKTKIKQNKTTYPGLCVVSKPSSNTGKTDKEERRRKVRPHSYTNTVFPSVLSMWQGFLCPSKVGSTRKKGWPLFFVKKGQIRCQPMIVGLRWGLTGSENPSRCHTAPIPLPITTGYILSFKNLLFIQSIKNYISSTFVKHSSITLVCDFLEKTSHWDSSLQRPMPRPTAPPH